MPRLDGSGPQGLGAGTGWGMGPCGAGLRRGRTGLGRVFGWPKSGYGRRYLSRSEELNALKEEKADLQADLKVLEEEIKTLSK